MCCVVIVMLFIGWQKNMLDPVEQIQHLDSAVKMALLFCHLFKSFHHHYKNCLQKLIHAMQHFWIKSGSIMLLWHLFLLVSNVTEQFWLEVALGFIRSMVNFIIIMALFFLKVRMLQSMLNYIFMIQPMPCNIDLTIIISS